MTTPVAGHNLAQEETTNPAMATDLAETELLAPERAAMALEVTKTNLLPVRTANLAVAIVWVPSRTSRIAGAPRVDPL